MSHNLSTHNRYEVAVVDGNGAAHNTIGFARKVPALRYAQAEADTWKDCPGAKIVVTDTLSPKGRLRRWTTVIPHPSPAIKGVA